MWVPPTQPEFSSLLGSRMPQDETQEGRVLGQSDAKVFSILFLAPRLQALTVLLVFVLKLNARASDET